MMFDDFCFVNAKESEKDDVLNFYHSLLGTVGCAWSEDYPAITEIEDDIKRNSLFLLKDNTGKIAATISIDNDPFVKALEFWKDPNGAEISRLGVATEFQNRGIARYMIESVSMVIKSRGYKSVRYLVCKHNQPALNSYRKLQFEKVGECRLFEEDFFCYEKYL